MPAADYNGTVPLVTYTIDDGLNTDTSTLTITVTPQPENDLTDGNETASTNEDTTLISDAGALLDNASSSDGTPEITDFTVGGNTYTAGQTANLTEGDLTIHADGSYTFVPAADYNGTVPLVTYTIDDGLNTDTSTLTITVTPQPENDLTDGNETASTNEDTTLISDAGALLDNASSSDGTPEITDFTVGGNTYNAGQTVNLTEGDLTIHADGSYTFVPAADYNGTVPVVTYTIDDGLNTDTSTLTISVMPQPENDLTDGNETASTNEDTTLTSDAKALLKNASSSDGTPEITDFTVGGNTYNAGQTANLTEGDLTIHADGSYTFVPAADYNGTVPVVTYTIDDGLNTDTSTLTISVTPQPENDLTDGNETASTNEDTTLTSDAKALLKNASSSDGAPEITDFTVGGNTYTAGQTANLTEGDLTIHADGSYTFVPAADYNGTVPLVTYTIDDGLNTDTSTLTITVTPQPENDLTDGNETASTNEDTTLTSEAKALLKNASSSDGTPEITDFTVGGNTYNAGQTANLTEGDLTIHADGSYTFVPAADYNGTVPVVTYTIDDGLNTDTSTLTISVTPQPENDLTDGNETASTNEDTTLTSEAKALLNNASSLRWYA